MLSRLQTSYRLASKAKPILINNHDSQLALNFLSKRSSGHNAMEITPSNFGWKHFKDMVHFYTLLSIVPVAVITTIINIKANPELTEIPEGYEPRHWEYYKHPITRWMARYMYKPMEIEHELNMAMCEEIAETNILKKIEKAVDKVMHFYGDHRTRYFKPFYAEYFRIGRDDASYLIPHMNTNEGQYLDYAYDPEFNPVPTEGFVPDSPSID